MEEIVCDECGYKHLRFDLDLLEVYCPQCGLVMQDKVYSSYDDLFYSPWFGTRKIIQKIQHFSFGRFKDSNYTEWRNKVIAKAKGKCLKCGNKGTHCHHIKNYSQYPELRFDVDNGILFCRDCHELFHVIYGKQDNDEYQLNDFLKTDFSEEDHDCGVLEKETTEI